MVTTCFGISCQPDVITFPPTLKMLQRCYCSRLTLSISSLTTVPNSFTVVTFKVASDFALMAVRVFPFSYVSVVFLLKVHSSPRKVCLSE